MHILQISKEGVRWSLLQRPTVKSHYVYQHLHVSTCSLEVSGVDLNGAMSNLRLDLLIVLSSLLVAWLPVFRSCIPYVSVHVDLENCHTHVHVPHLQQSSVLTCKHIQCACVRPQILPSPKQIETKRRGNVQIFLTVSAFDDALHVLVDLQSVHTNNKHIHSGAEVSICLFEFSCC